jgi:DNA repair protein RadC
MTDTELLATLLHLSEDAAPRAGEILSRFGSLSALSRCSVEEIATFPAIGQRRAMLLVAAFSLGPRIARERYTRQKLDSPELVYDFLAPAMQQLHTESLRVILLDTRYHLLRLEEVSRGSVNESIAHPRDVFRPAVISSAYAVIVVHNHPSGDPSPSQSDHGLTRRLTEAAELLQIKLLDHIIIGAPAEGRLPYFSFKEAGVL